jgi:hypothetical protein
MAPKGNIEKGHENKCTLQIVASFPSFPQNPPFINCLTEKLQYSPHNNTMRFVISQN